MITAAINEMNTDDASKIRSENPEFPSRFRSFLTAIQGRMVKHYVADGMPNQMSIITFDEGSKYIRLWRRDREILHKNGEIIFSGKLRSGKTVYAFIDKNTGNIYKADGWKKPNTKHIRGNIFEADYGLAATGPYGIEYLRGGSYPWDYTDPNS